MMEITTSLLFLFSAFYGTGTAEASTRVDSVKVPEAYPIVAVAQVNTAMAMPIPTTNAKEAGSSVESLVREYFADTPVLIKVAECESGFRQYDSQGNVVRGIVNPQDVGVMQINEYYHKSTADSLGFDLKTTEGNLKYGKWLYEHEGAAPWVYSSKCWAKGEFANVLAVKK